MYDQLIIIITIIISTVIIITIIILSAWRFNICSYLVHKHFITTINITTLITITIIITRVKNIKTFFLPSGARVT